MPPSHIHAPTPHPHPHPQSPPPPPTSHPSVIPDQCQGQVTEERVVEKAFNLLFAFDEAITSGGYKEHVTLANIKTYLVRDAGDLMRDITALAVWKGDWDPVGAET